MKYVIEIFKNGVRSDVLVTNDKYDWDGCGKLFSNKLDSYLNKGYKIIKEVSGSDRSYNVLFNEDEMKTAVVSAKLHTESDFIDADRQPIILSKLYRSEENGDRYSINESPYEWKGKLYLRNADKWDSHTETVNSCLQIETVFDGSRMSRTVHDKYDFDQKFIGSLKLHHIWVSSNKDKIV